MSAVQPGAGAGLAASASRSFAVLALAYTVSQFFRVSNAVIAPELMREVGLSPEVMGLVTGAFFFAFAAMQIPTGVLLDRFGARRTMSALLAVAALGSAVFALSPDASGLVLGRVLIGVGCAAGLMGSLVVISRWYPPERFAAMSSWLFTIGGAGILLATTPLAALTGWVGWRGAFWLMAAVTLIMAGLIAWLVRDGPGAASGPEPDTGPRPGLVAALRGLGEVIRNRQLWHVSALQFVCYGTVLSIAGLWAGPYLHEVHGLDGAARGTALLVVNVASLAGVMIYSAVERRVGSRKRTIIGGGLLSAATLLVLAALPGAHLGVVLVLLVAFALFSAYVMLLHSHARAVLPDHLIGRGLTLQNLAVFLGVAALQAATGWIVGSNESNLAEVAGGGPEAAYRAVFAFLAVATLAAVAAYSPVRDARPAGSPAGSTREHADP